MPAISIEFVVNQAVESELPVLPGFAKIHGSAENRSMLDIRFVANFQTPG